MHLRSTHACVSRCGDPCSCLFLFICIYMHRSSRDIPYVDEEKMGKGQQLCGEDAQSQCISRAFACAWKLALRLCACASRANSICHVRLHGNHMMGSLDDDDVVVRQPPHVQTQAQPRMGGMQLAVQPSHFPSSLLLGFDLSSL